MLDTVQGFVDSEGNVVALRARRRVPCSVAGGLALQVDDRLRQTSVQGQQFLTGSSQFSS